MGTYNSLSRCVIGALFACAIFLRVAVPAGYMPTNVDGGWFLQLCPDGISVSAMGALFGDEHAHHHAEHAAHADDGETYSPCELGNGLTGDALTTLKLDPFRAFDSPNPYQPLNDWRPSGNAWRAFRPRAPPHSGLLQHLL